MFKQYKKYASESVLKWLNKCRTLYLLLIYPHDVDTAPLPAIMITFQTLDVLNSTNVF